MADINDPGALTIEGQPVKAAEPDPFENLEAKASTPAETPASSDAALDSAEAIREALADPAITVNLASGVTVSSEAESQPALEDVGFTVEGERVTAKQAWDALNDTATQLEATQARLAEVETDNAFDAFWAKLESAEDAVDVTEAVTSLTRAYVDSQITREQLDAARFEAARQWLYGDADDEAIDLDEVESAADSLARQAEQVIASEHYERNEQRIAELTPRVAEARAAEYHAIAKEFARDIGARSDEAANQAIQAAVDFARDELHIDMEAMLTSTDGTWDAKAFDALLRSSWATVADQADADESRAVQQSVLDTESSSVADGIERWTPYGWVNPNAVELPPAMVNEDRVVQRAQAKRESPESIKAGLLEESQASIAGGLTDASGKPTTAYVASGQEARDKAEREAQRARDRGLLR